jgi:hypothetical protein
VHLSAQRLGKQSLNLPSNIGRPSKQLHTLTTQLLSQTLPKMTTHQGTDQSALTCQMQEKQAAELVLQKKIEEERTKCQQEKQQCKEEHRKEEKSRKQLEGAKKVRCNADATAARHCDSSTCLLKQT